MMKNQLQRQSNFELLRIFSMLIIVSSHFACHGVQRCLQEEGFVVYNMGSFVNKSVVSFMNPGGWIGVALFFMITGYFQIEKKKPNIMNVVLESLFYGISSVILYFIFELFLDGFAIEKTTGLVYQLIKAIFIPVTGGTWWFVSSYVVVLMVSPVINNFLFRLNKKGYIALIVSFWLLWYTIAYATEAPFFDLQRCVFYYMIGAFCKIHLHKVEKGKINLIIIALIVWIIGTFLYRGVSITVLDSTVKGKFLCEFFNICNMSLVVPICAFVLFRLFESINIGIVPPINVIAKTTFGIYLISESFVGRKFIWDYLFNIQYHYLESKYFAAYSIAVIGMIFITCSLIDLVRIKWIEPVMIRNAKKIIEKIKLKFVKS